MREKLLDLMKSEGLKPSQLAELLEINPAGISHILAGRNKPGFDCIATASPNNPHRLLRPNRRSPTGCSVRSGTRRPTRRIRSRLQQHPKIPLPR